MTATTSLGSHRVRELWPGLALVAAITAVAVLPTHFIDSSPMIWAFAVGIVLGPLVRRSRINDRPGVELSSTTFLRIGVALLGLGISLGQALSIGVPGIAVASGTILITLAAALWLGPRLGIEKDLSLLIAMGSAVCGASAIAATSAAVRANRVLTGYAIATITLFGTASMLLVPILVRLLGLDDERAGIWIGASIQEVAQVTVAGAAVSIATLKIAALVKLVRVALLPLALIAVRFLEAGPRRETDHSTKPPAVPLFVIGFIGLMLVRTVLPVPDGLISFSRQAAVTLQAAALGAIGLQVDISDLRSRGAKPLLLGLCGTSAAIGASLIGVLVLA